MSKNIELDGIKTNENKISRAANRLTNAVCRSQHATINKGLCGTLSLYLQSSLG